MTNSMLIYLGPQKYSRVRSQPRVASVQNSVRARCTFLPSYLLLSSETALRSPLRFADAC